MSWHCPLLAEECQRDHAHKKSVLTKSLEDVDVDVFGLFVSWLYTEQLVNKRGKPPFQHRSMGLWILANRLRMPRLCNDALDALELRRRQEGGIQTRSFVYVYSNTTEEDPLRRYVVDVCILLMPSFSDDIKTEHFPEELTQDIFAASLIDGMKIKTEDGEIDTTKYHSKVTK